MGAIVPLQLPHSGSRDLRFAMPGHAASSKQVKELHPGVFPWEVHLHSIYRHKDISINVHSCVGNIEA